MGTDLGSAPPYSGNTSVSYTSVEEAMRGEGPEGQQAAEGTEPVAVESGDSISSLMARQGLDWGNPADRRQFLADNPQFITREDVEQFPELASLFDPDSGRNPDLIWPGEVLYIRPPQGGGSESTNETPATDTDGDGIPDPADRTQARTTTDTAADELEQAEQQLEDYKRTAGPDGGLVGELEDIVEAAKLKLAAAYQAEVETGLRDFIAENPDATPEEIKAEAERLSNEIQGRSQTLSGMPESTIDFRTQQAINVVSAEQYGINLDGVGPGTTVRDGPYTDTYGPFEPGTTIKDEDGRDIRIDDNGHIANGTILVTDPETGETRYEVYEGGVRTGQSWDGLPERPGAPSETPEPSDTSPVLRVADPPLNNKDETDAAAQDYYEASVESPDGAATQREAFMAAVRAELANGTSLEEIKERYGNDPFLNEAIDEAAYGPR